MLSVTRRVFESPKCDKYVWRPGGPAGGSLTALPRPPSRNRGRGPAPKGEGRGRIGKGKGRNGRGRGIGRAGKMDGRVLGRGLPPLYLTSGYGPVFGVLKI